MLDHIKICSINVVEHKYSELNDWNKMKRLRVLLCFMKHREQTSKCNPENARKPDVMEWTGIIMTNVAESGIDVM